MGNVNLIRGTADGRDVMDELEDDLQRLYALPEIRGCIPPEHTKNTPRRIADTFADLYSGCFTDPKTVLETRFDANEYNEMVFVNNIKFVSTCAHHGLPFFGKAHFAYMPAKSIVGLSKIPRLVEVLARRPQVQEKLTQEIVNTFYEEVQPLGCGVMLEGYHLCMMIRGVRNDSAYTKTTALQGDFRQDVSLKQEFLDGVRQVGAQVWP